jgi:hypothetical protein
MWPIVAVLWVQATRHRLWQLPHIQLISALVGVISLMALFGPGLADSRLFLPVAPLAILAAFGLLSMPRSLTSLLDWFAVVVFTSLGTLIWLYWSAMSFGFPQNLASRLAVFAPGLENPMPGPLEVFFGVAISGAWIILVLWRIRRGRPRLWRPVVLSAGGLILAWILMMTLWMPALDINRGYNHLTPRLERAVSAEPASCIRTAPDDRTSRALVLASQRLSLGEIGQDQDCRLLMVQVGPEPAQAPAGGQLIWTGQRAADRKDRERYLLYRLTDKK